MHKFHSFIIALSALLVTSCEHSLSDIKMGVVAVSHGETLVEVALKMQNSLNSCGSDWKICVDSDVALSKSSGNFGSGGTALAIPIIAKNFNCKCLTLKNEKRFLLIKND
jgi:hypothetical protein